MNSKRNKRRSASQPSPKPGNRRSNGPGRAKAATRGKAAGRGKVSGRSDAQQFQGRRAKPQGLGGDHVEGRHAVRELLVAGRRKVHEIFILEGMDRADAIEDIETLALDFKVPLRQFNKKRFNSIALTESHQGVIAKAEPVEDVTLDSLLQVPAPFLLVLDGITDPGNVGALLRTAECAGVTGVVFPKHRAAGLTPTATKTAAGAIEYLQLGQVGGVPTAVQNLNDAGVLTVGLDAAAELPIHEIDIANDRPVALILGAEGKGLSRLVKQRATILAAIPMAGYLNSLNVATAGGVACFEVVRQRAATSDKIK